MKNEQPKDECKEKPEKTEPGTLDAAVKDELREKAAKQAKKETEKQFEKELRKAEQEQRKAASDAARKEKKKLVEEKKKKLEEEKAEKEKTEKIEKEKTKKSEKTSPPKPADTKISVLKSAKKDKKSSDTMLAEGTPRKPASVASQEELPPAPLARQSKTPEDESDFGDETEEESRKLRTVAAERRKGRRSARRTRMIRHLADLLAVVVLLAILLSLAYGIYSLVMYLRENLRTEEQTGVSQTVLFTVCANGVDLSDLKEGDYLYPMESETDREGCLIDQITEVSGEKYLILEHLLVYKANEGYFLGKDTRIAIGESVLFRTAGGKPVRLTVVDFPYEWETGTSDESTAESEPAEAEG